jgi:hypothetical protein
MKNKIYQIYYSNETKLKNDQGFLQLDNLANDRPDWREYWPIRKFLLNNQLDDDTRYGFLSPKFKEKTDLEANSVMNFVENDDSDVIIFSPYFVQSALYFNVFEQQEEAHPGSVAIACQCLKEIYPEVNIFTILMDARSTVFCNYFVAKKHFWMKWFECCEKIFAIAENNNSPLAKVLNSHVVHESATAPLKVFIVERIASLLIEKESIKTKTYNNMGFKNTDKIWDEFKNELVILEALKIACKSTGFENFMAVFDSERVMLLKKIKKRIEITHN